MVKIKESSAYTSCLQTPTSIKLGEGGVNNLLSHEMHDFLSLLLSHLGMYNTLPSISIMSLTCSQEVQQIWKNTDSRHRQMRTSFELKLVMTKEGYTLYSPSRNPLNVPIYPYVIHSPSSKPLIVPIYPYVIHSQPSFSVIS